MKHDNEPNRVELVLSWEAIIPTLVHLAVKGGSPSGRKEAMDQLVRLAKTVDAMNAQAREEAASPPVERKRDDYLLAAALMQKMGGSFACAIADAFITADSHNTQRLLAAFPEMFDRYRRLAEVQQD